MEKSRSSTAEELTFGDTVSKLGGELRDVGSHISQAANRTASEVGKLGEEKLHELREYGDVYISRLETMIKERPVQSLLVGAAAGFLLGRLLTRS